MSEQVIEEQEEPKEPEAEEKATEGKDPVDFTPAQQQRFNRIYGNMKEYERLNEQLLRDQKRLTAKTEALQERLEGLLQDSTAQRRETLNAEKASAYQEGDIDKVLEIDRKLEQVKDPDPIPEPEPEQGMPEHMQTRINSWSNEINDEGDYLRPWSHPGHPKFNEAVAIAQEVANSPRFANLDTETVLEEIDKRVKQELFPKKVQAQTVLSGNGATPPKDKGTVLNADQKQAAHLLYPKMSQKDAEARYAIAMKDLES